MLKQTFTPVFETIEIFIVTTTRRKKQPVGFQNRGEDMNPPLFTLCTIHFPLHCLCFEQHGLVKPSFEPQFVNRQQNMDWENIANKKNLLIFQIFLFRLCQCSYTQNSSEVLKKWNSKQGEGRMSRARPVNCQLKDNSSAATVPIKAATAPGTEMKNHLKQ